jgi:N-acetylmuramoyl-L-alanine amidase
LVRRAIPFLLVGLALPGSAHAATLTLTAPDTVAFGRTVAFTGALQPAQPGVQVRISTVGPSPQIVTTATTDASGAFSAAVVFRSPGTFMADATVGPATVVSAPVSIALRARLTTRVRGVRAVGSRLLLTGRIQPRTAGHLTLHVLGKARRVRIGAVGRFSATLPTPVPRRLRWTLTLTPATGFATVRRSRVYGVRGPTLAWGDTGRSVLALERRLHELHYALVGPNGVYGYDTYSAVMAFQKVNGLARTGRVSSYLWTRLARATVPRAFNPHGTHIEVSKTKQILYEVRNGKGVNVSHGSTGATGNTPVGRFHVYRLGPGTNAKGMYYSLYFLRGFAIHGYASVPPYQASHGCVRTPLWFAYAFYRRWAHIGTEIDVFA